MPRTILEAMAMKLPIIATNIAAIPGVLNETNAVLINPNIVNELVDAIDNDNLRKEIALNAYKDVVNK